MKSMSIRRPDTNRFAREPQLKIGRSQFDLSHGRKMTFSASYLYPILVQEVIPGDTFTCSLNGVCRIWSPLDAPLMDDIRLDTMFFFVPNRLVWSNWAAFMGEHDDAGAQDTTYTVPVLATGLTVDHTEGVQHHNLAAYMGLPEGLQTAQVSVSALPFRAYNLIYDEFFRDQNIINSEAVTLGNGPDTLTDYDIYKSAKVHDYFTSALPYLQKGSAQEVAIVSTANPSSGKAFVKTPAIVDEDISVYSTTLSQYHEMSSDANEVDLDVNTDTDASHTLFISAGDLGVDINALRQSVAIQRLLEKDARGGTRYTELIRAHFGVTNPDFRLQRPEYLGGGRSYINVSPVANTSAVDSTAHPGSVDEYAGQLRGVGAGTIHGHGWAKSFTEHGYIIGLVRARGQITYHQGLHRHWSRSSKYDFYWPELAHLGEQGVLNKEIYVSNSSATDDAVFGYVPRWEEMRWKPSEVVGLFDPNVSGTLSFWHLAEDFGSLPTLNQTFIEDQTPMARVTTVDSQPDFAMDLWFNLKAARPMPVHAIPSLGRGRV